MATASSAATVWKKLDNTNLAALGNPFGANLLHVRDQKTASTVADNLTNSTWNTRVLQTTVTNEITSASLSANQISLPAGTYFLDAWAPFNFSNNSSYMLGKLKLYNVTGSADLIVGPTTMLNMSVNTLGGTLMSTIKGRFTLSGTTTLELRHWVTTVNSGGYVSTGSSTAEVYAEVMIWRVS